MPQKFEAEHLEFDRMGIFREDYTSFLFDHIGLEPGMLIVEPGCGTGFLLRKIAKKQYSFGLLSRMSRKLHKKNRIIGIDIDPKLVHFGNEYVKFEGLSSVIDLKVGDVYNMSLVSNSADMAICHMLLCNIEEPLRAIKEMVRVTKKGGTLVAVEPDNSQNIYYYPKSERYTRLVQKANKFSIDGYKKVYGGDLSIGPKVPSLFLKTGLNDIQLYGHLSIVLSCGSQLKSPGRLLTTKEKELILGYNKKKWEEERKILSVAGIPKTEIDEIINYESKGINVLLEDSQNIRYDASVTAFPIYLTTGKKK